MTDVEALAREVGDLVRTILDSHHAYVKAHLPDIGRAVQAAAKAAPEHAATQVFARTYSAVHNDLVAHLQKEEQVLFPMLEELQAALLMGREPHIMACGVHAPVNQMRFEHAQARDFFAQLLAALDRPTDDEKRPRVAAAMEEALRELEADLQEHMRKEEELLFPKAEALFDAVTVP